MLDNVGTVYTIWQTDGSRANLDPESAPLVDRAVKLWVTERRDSWVSVTNHVGADYSLLASTVTSSMLTTTATRFAATEREKLLEDELKEHRRSVGYIESEP